MKKCKFCQKEVDNKAVKCPYCQSDIRNWFNKHPLFTILLIFLGISIIIAVVSSSNESTPVSTPSSVSTPSHSVSNQQKVNVGEEGILQNQSNNEILIPINKEAYDEITKLSIAKDNMGIAQLVLEGKAFFVKSGTKALVIDRETFSRRIRILEGEQVGQSGWVPYEWVAPIQK